MSTARADLVLDVAAADPRAHAARLFVTRNPTLVAGTFVLLLLTLSAIAAPVWTATDPQQMQPSIRLHPPDAEHPFGTDHFGRDVFARTLYGGRISLRVGLVVALLALGIGTVIGLVSGYYRALDAVVMRVVDGLMAIPSILLALALMALVRASVETVIAALVVPEIPRVVRVVRAQVLSLREQTMVEGARAVGAGTPRILFVYILPALVAPLIVQGTHICALAILVESYLSFLGAGTPPHIPSWGNIMAEGRAYVQLAVWIILFPGLFLMATVLSINLIGDGLRDLLKV